jgi:YD repeat-containing protein
MTALSYDAADQLTRSTSTSSGATFLDQPYTRDGVGQLTSANPLGTSPGVTQSYAYDSANRLVDTAMPAGPASVPNTTYGYDAADHLTGITTAGVLTRSLGYDAATELVSSCGAAGTTSLTYDQHGNRATRTSPQGHLTSYGFDQANRLTSYVGPAMSAATPRSSPERPSWAARRAAPTSRSTTRTTAMDCAWARESGDIDSLFSDTIDMEEIATHWQDLMRVVLSIKVGSAPIPYR